MIRRSHTNTEMLKLAARRFGPLLDQVVFVGGATTNLFITDTGAPDARPTMDVDVIIDVLSRYKYSEIEMTLRSLGFRHDITEGAPLCRWIVDGMKVDVMPTDGNILGFTNDWYTPAIQNAIHRDIGEGIIIKIVTAPYFLATKLEAFHDRGNNDYMASHDMEDIIAVIDGRLELADEIKSSEPALIFFVASQFKQFLMLTEFRDAIPGHLPPDNASQLRVPIVIERLRDFAYLA